MGTHLGGTHLGLFSMDMGRSEWKTAIWCGGIPYFKSEDFSRSVQVGFSILGLFE